MFSCEYYEIFQNFFLEEHLQWAAFNNLLFLSKYFFYDFFFAVFSNNSFLEKKLSSIKWSCQLNWWCSCYNAEILSRTVWEVPKYGVFSGPCFPAFGLNTEIYGVNLYFDGVFGHFSRSDICFSQRKLGAFMMVALEC